MLGHESLGRVLVTGAGPVGLLAALMGVQRGLEVHVLDRVSDGPKPGVVEALDAADASWLSRLVTRKVPVEFHPDALEKRDGDIKTVVTF